MTGGVSTLLEWDANIPEFPELVSELRKADRVLKGALPEIPVHKSDASVAISNPVDFQIALHD